MALKEVELIRRRVVAGMSNEVVRLRAYISSIDGNQEAVDNLRGESAQDLIATMTESVMLHLGHANEVTRLNDGGSRLTSQARKAARKAPV